MVVLIDNSKDRINERFGRQLTRGRSKKHPHQIEMQTMINIHQFLPASVCMKQFSYQKNNSLCTFDYSSVTLNYAPMSSNHYFLFCNYVCLPFNYCFCHSMFRQRCLSHSSLCYRLLTFNYSISISIDYLRVPDPAKVLLNT